MLFRSARTAAGVVGGVTAQGLFVLGFAAATRHGRGWKFGVGVASVVFVASAFAMRGLGLNTVEFAILAVITLAVGLKLVRADQAGVAVRVPTWSEALTAALSWAQPGTHDHEVSRQCREFVQRHAGAVHRSVDRLSTWLV